MSDPLPSLDSFMAGDPLSELAPVQSMTGSTTVSIPMHIMTSEESRAYDQISPYQVRDGKWMTGDWQRQENGDVVELEQRNLRRYQEVEHDELGPRTWNYLDAEYYPIRVWDYALEAWREPTIAETTEHTKRETKQWGNFDRWVFPVITNMGKQDDIRELLTGNNATSIQKD